MIIGEQYNNSSFDEDNYDYLFKRKPKDVRQQKKAGRKQNGKFKKENRRPGRAGAPGAIPFGKRKLIRGNFGLSAVNQNNAANDPGTQDPNDPALNTPEQNPVENALAESSPEANPANIPGNGSSLPADQDNNTFEENSGNDTEAGYDDYEDSYDEDHYEDDYDEPKQEAGNKAAEKSTTKTDKDAKEKKSTSGAAFGWVCLGITVLVVGYIAFKSIPAEERLKISEPKKNL